MSTATNDPMTNVIFERYLIQVYLDLMYRYYGWRR
jgi:hypothetical protein